MFWASVMMRDGWGGLIEEAFVVVYRVLFGLNWSVFWL